MSPEPNPSKPLPASASAASAEDALPVDDSAGLFTRKATGLVRQVTPASSVIVNYIPGSPVYVLVAALFFALSVYPGGNIYLGLLLVLPMMLAYSYTFGLLTSAIPRSGGDYTFVSRILHPALGMTSSVFMAIAQFLSIAFYAIALTTTAVGPGLINIGVIANDPGLISFGNTVINSHGWQFGLGVGMVLIAALMHSVGWRWSLRLMVIVFGITMFGLLASTLIILFTSHQGFINDFNSVLQPLTHKPDTYNAVIAKAQHAGVDTDPGFSFSNTLPIVGVLAGFSVYTYFSSFVGGELRQARSVGTANRMALAGVLNIVGLVICILIFFHTFGTQFINAGFGGGMPGSVPTQPSYFFLAPVIANSAVLAAILALCYALFWPLLTYVIFLQPTRAMFAYAFDGVLPKKITAVSSRTHAPYVAITITAVLSIATIAWAVYLTSATFFQVLIYAVLVQLISQGLLMGISAIVFPKRRPELYRASSDVSLFGIPLVVIAGVGSLVSSCILWTLYFKYPDLGLTNVPKFFLWVGIPFVASLVYYVAAKRYLMRKGVNIDHVYREIPPE